MRKSQKILVNLLTTIFTLKSLNFYKANVLLTGLILEARIFTEVRWQVQPSNDFSPVQVFLILNFLGVNLLYENA